VEEIIHTHLYSILSLFLHQMASPCTSTIHDHDQRSATLYVIIWVQCERFHKMWSWYVVLYGYSHDLVATHWLVWVRPSSGRNLLLCWTTPRRAWVKFGPGPGPAKKIWLVLLDRARHDRRFIKSSCGIVERLVRHQKTQRMMIAIRSAIEPSLKKSGIEPTEQRGTSAQPYHLCLQLTGWWVAIAA